MAKKAALRFGLSTLAAALSSMALTAFAFADESPQTAGQLSFLKKYQEPTVSSQFEVPWWSFSIDLALKLALILGLIYLTIFLLRRVMGSGRGGFIRPQSVINVIESSHLAPNRSIYLIEIAGRILVVGASATQLQTLAVIDDPGTVEAIKSGANSGLGFAAQLKLLGNRLKRESGLGTSEGLEVDNDATGVVSETKSLQDKINDLRRLSSMFRDREQA